MSGRKRYCAGVGVIVGLALLWWCRRTRIEGGAFSGDLPQSVEPTVNGNSAVPPLYQVAGDKAIFYLRGYMDGQREAP